MMDTELLQNTIESMEWMTKHFIWAHNQTGLGGSYSSELTEAIETLEELKEQAVKL